MAATSSTSSSKRCGVPWAFLMAVGIMLIVEVVLRTRDPHKMIAYPQLAAYEDQTVTYTAVRQFVDADSPAEVALVGSSQMREGVVVPEIEESLKQQLGRDVRVANYAIRGARADGTESVVRYLLKQPSPPRVVVIGLSVRDLRTSHLDWPRLAVFWDIGDWAREVGADRHALDALPVVIRNELSKVSYTLRYRDQLAIDIARPLAKFGIEHPRESNPILGEMAYQHIGPRGEKTMDRAFSLIAPRKLLARARDAYAYDESQTPAAPMRLRLESMLAELKARNIRAILVEMPVAPLLRDDLALKHQKPYEDYVTETATLYNAKFVPGRNLPFPSENQHFSDLQHYNRAGAQQFGKWLAGEIAAELK